MEAPDELELAEVERMARFIIARGGGALGVDRMVVLMAEYDRRGVALEEQA